MAIQTERTTLVKDEVIGGIEISGSWYLKSLSTIFQLYRGVSFICGGNRSTLENHRPPASH